MNSFIALLVLYMLAGTAIALYNRGARTQDEYFVAGRNVSGIISALTYAATTYSAFMMVGLVGFSYFTGVGATGFELMYLVGTLFLLSYYAPKVWRLGREKNIVSPTEFLSHRYGVVTSRIAAVIALIALIPYISAQLIGVALMMKIGGVEFYAGIAIAAVLIALWAYLGGLRGVAWTDAFQGVIMLLAATGALLFVTQKTDFSSVDKLGSLLYVPNEFWTFGRFAAFVTPWFFFALTNPQVFQRIFIPATEKDLKRMVIYFGLFGLVYTFIVTLLGLELRIQTETGVFPRVEDRDMVTPTLLGIMPEWLAFIVALSILAAAITTANSIILSLSSMISRDVIREKGIAAGRISVLVLTIVVAIFASQRISYIVELSVLSSTILLCQLPLIVGYFHWGRGREIAGVTTLLSGFVISILLWHFKINPFGIPSSVATLIVVSSVYLAASLLEGKKGKE